MAEGQVYFEDVEVGMAIPSLQKKPSNTLLFLYSAVTWNPQRIHYDKEYTLTEGYRDVIVHGPLRGAFLSQLLTRWIGEEGTLKKLSYTNRDIAYVNELLTCKGTVSGIRAEISASKPSTRLPEAKSGVGASGP